VNEKMSRDKANHTRPGMNAAKAQGKGAGYNTEFGNESLALPNEKLSEAERQNNKKTKKRH
jgi:small acid-soluble spore protein O (minor)